MKFISTISHRIVNLVHYSVRIRILLKTQECPRVSEGSLKDAKSKKFKRRRPIKPRQASLGVSGGTDM